MTTITGLAEQTNLLALNAAIEAARADVDPTHPRVRGRRRRSPSSPRSPASAQQVSASTQETSASTQEIAASAADLARTADELDALVRRFKVRV